MFLFISHLSFWGCAFVFIKKKKILFLSVCIQAETLVYHQLVCWNECEMLLFPPRRVCVSVCVYATRDRNTQPWNQEADRWRKISFLVVFYLFILLWTVILLHHTVRMFSRACSVISLGCGDGDWGAILYSSWSSEGSFVEEVLPLGGPSQSISNETESACSSPNSFPQGVWRKCFPKRCYNTLSHHNHTQTLTLFFQLIQIQTLGHLLTLQQESRLRSN